MFSFSFQIFHRVVIKKKMHETKLMSSVEGLSVLNVRIVVIAIVIVFVMATVMITVTCNGHAVTVTVTVNV